MNDFAAKLRELAKDEELIYNVGRRAVEDVLVDMRDSGMSLLGRNNGLVIKYKDGSSSDIIRMTTDSAISIALEAIANHIDLIAEEKNPFLPKVPEDGKHFFGGDSRSYRCIACGAYNRSDTPEYSAPCRGAYAESGKMRAWAADEWEAEKRRKKDE